MRLGSGFGGYFYRGFGAEVAVAEGHFCYAEVALVHDVEVFAAPLGRKAYELDGRHAGFVEDYADVFGEVAGVIVLLAVYFGGDVGAREVVGFDDVYSRDFEDGAFGVAALAVPVFVEDFGGLGEEVVLFGGEYYVALARGYVFFVEGLQ